MKQDLSTIRKHQSSTRFFLVGSVFLTILVFWFVFDMFLVRMVFVSVDCPFGFL
jgi:hypothetical protein